MARESTTWPENNCLQIMVCSCAMSSNFVWLQIPVIFCSCVNETTLFSFLRLLLCESDRALHFPMKIFIRKKSKLGDRMIKQLLNSSIARYRDLSVSRRSITGLSLRLHNWRRPFYLVEINIVYWGAPSRVSKNIWTIRWAPFASALTNHLLTSLIS